jgi:hypothetical protein
MPAQPTLSAKAQQPLSTADEHVAAADTRPAQRGKLYSSTRISVAGSRWASEPGSANVLSVV